MEGIGGFCWRRWKRGREKRYKGKIISQVFKDGKNISMGLKNESFCIGQANHLALVFCLKCQKILDISEQMF